VAVEGECSCSRQPIKQYKRKKIGSVKGGNFHNQKLIVGKLGRFLAPMKLGLNPLKPEWKLGSNTINNAATVGKREMHGQTEIDHKRKEVELVGNSQIIK
jgi:hypothetical protein